MTDSSKVTLSRVFLVNASIDETSFPLTSSTVVEQDGVSVTLFLSEAERARAIGLSGTSGGDGNSLRATLSQGAFLDIGENPSVATEGMELNETRDSQHPRLVSSHINLGTGILTVTADETIDATPRSLVLEELLTIRDETQAAAGQVSVEDAIVAEADGVSIILQLSEAQRVAALLISGTPGGDGSTSVLDAEAAAMQDIATNTLLESFNVTMQEVDDTIPPFFSGTAYLNLDNGTLIFSASETIRASFASYTNLSNVHLSNVSGSLAASDGSQPATTSAYWDHPSIPLSGAAWSKVDALSVTIQLSEAMRVAAIRISSQPGETWEACRTLPLMTYLEAMVGLSSWTFSRMRSLTWV